jgi:hypothetical protein
MRSHLVIVPFLFGKTENRERLGERDSIFQSKESRELTHEDAPIMDVLS